MEELKSAMEDHMEQMADLVQKLSAELRSGLRPAYDNFIGFFHAIDWRVHSSSFIVCFLSWKQSYMHCSAQIFKNLVSVSRLLLWFPKFHYEPTIQPRPDPKCSAKCSVYVIPEKSVIFLFGQMQASYLMKIYKSKTPFLCWLLQSVNFW